MRPAAQTREDYIDSATTMFAVIASPAYPIDEDRVRERAGRAWDRSFHPSGVARQLMAVLASGDRTRELRTITAPTLVIHGLEDRLIPKQGGKDTAAAIPGARLELIEGMGHDLPVELWPQTRRPDRRERRPRGRGAGQRRSLRPDRAPRRRWRSASPA